MTTLILQAMSSSIKKRNRGKNLVPQNSVDDYTRVFKVARDKIRNPSSGAYRRWDILYKLSKREDVTTDEIWKEVRNQRNINFGYKKASESKKTLKNQTLGDNTTTKETSSPSIREKAVSITNTASNSPATNAKSEHPNFWAVVKERQSQSPRTSPPASSILVTHPNTLKTR